MGGSRYLARGEVALAREVFGTAIDYGRVTIRRRKFLPFQPRRITMAPMGHLHFHPHSHAYCDDFAAASLAAQGLFIHEMVHVWQAQTRGQWYLPIARHPFCRYDYTLVPGKPLTAYGIEQQAMIVQHAFLLRRGAKLAGVAGKAAYETLVAFPGATLPA
ncbi:MAG: vgr related protein [Erythrobacter sp.]